ncbi:MAG: PAS domain S-box protein [Bdellovibrionia bacterium]
MADRPLSSQFSAHPTTAARLREQKESVLQLWESWVRKEIQASQGKESGVLRDSLPIFLDHLITSLETQSPRLANAKDIAQTHAVQRSKLTEFDLEQVMNEYNVLRQIIFQVLDDVHIVPSSHERNIILDFIQNGKMAAANRYMQLSIEQTRRSERRFRALYDLSVTGIAVTDPSTERFVQVNRKFAEMLGYTEDELRGKTISDVTHPEDMIEQRRIYRQAVKEKSTQWRLQKRYIRKDGSVLWTEIWSTPLHDEDGQPERVLSSVIDITEQKKSEETKSTLLRLEQSARRAAQESAAILDTIFATAPIGTALLDRELRYLQINSALAALNGVPAKDHIGRTLREILPDSASSLEPILRSVLETGEPALNQEFSHLETSGGRVHTLGNFYPIKHADGYVWGVGVMVVDITERERIEEERKKLLQSESEARTRAEQGIQRLQNLLRLTETALSPKTTLDEVLNRALEYIYDTFSADTVAILMADEAKDHLEVRAARGLEEEIVQNIKIPKGKGVAGRIMAEERAMIVDDLTHVEVASPIVKQKNLRCLMGVPLRTKQEVIGVIHVGRLQPRPFHEDELQFLQLIADRLATSMDNATLYLRLQKKLEELRAERELRERFVATVAHDLRNPLTSAKLSSQLVLRYPERTDARERQLGKIIYNLERADQMIQNLLDANRIRAGQRLPLEIDECDLHNIAQEVCEEQSMISGDRFVVDSPETVPGYWSCNGLHRILENLVSNGAKYGAPDTTVTTRIELHEDRVWITVHNLGPAIPESEQKILFEPFRRAKSAEKVGKPGWGLGLTLVRGLVEAHGGKVSIQSSEQEGTAFKVDLPIDARPFQVPKV